MCVEFMHLVVSENVQIVIILEGQKEKIQDTCTSLDVGGV